MTTQVNDRVALLANATATGNPVTVDGGTYVWDNSCATWNGASVQLQYRAGDESTFVNVTGASANANGSSGPFYIGGATVMKVTVTGTPSAGVYSTLKRVNR